MKTGKQSKRERMGYVYILPWIWGFLIFQAYPLIASFCYSFTDYAIIGKPVFVGLDNYIAMFTADSLFFTSLGNTLKFVFISLPMKIITALIVAVVLNQKLKGINIYRTLCYIPSIFGGSVAVAILWRFLFMDGGLVNRGLAVFHLPTIQWLSDPRLALFTLSLLSVWQFGSSMVLFLAALKQVSGNLYEAARIDGAGRLSIFFRITLPMITPVLFFTDPAILHSI
ncbi:MAG: sugar ABC transporter permease [Spirochaetaceae bacterium]|jgi:oligogalacturonide transport system permease protein|nr:sugar ABC transporter permease [Spirochaetaceae bacterium]